MFVITHPRPQLGAQTALGLEFRDGVALVGTLHPERHLALKQHGFIVTAGPIETPTPVDKTGSSSTVPSFAEPETGGEAYIPLKPRRHGKKGGGDGDHTEDLRDA